MAINRLMGFRVVKSTKPVQFVHAKFVPPREYRSMREVSHKDKKKSYPDQDFNLNATQKYFYRNESLRGLRIEQTNYYLATADGDPETAENTVPEPEDVEVDRSHKNYDAYMETIPEGTVFHSTCPDIESVRRRKQSRLGVNRTAFITPIGESREEHYEQQLLLTLPWFCESAPEKDADGVTHWTFVWEPPMEARSERLQRKELKLTDKTHVSFEHICKTFEDEICSKQSVVCDCCQPTTSLCKSCRFAVGFHRCEKKPGELRWRKHSLFGGSLDAERCLWNLHRLCLSS